MQWVSQYARILDLWVYIIHRVAKRQNKRNSGVCGLYAQIIGKNRAAPTEAMPTVFVVISNKDHRYNRVIAVLWLRVNNSPNSVATPLPPLPRKNNEHPLPNNRRLAKKQR